MPAYFMLDSSLKYYLYTHNVKDLGLHLAGCWEFWLQQGKAPKHMLKHVSGSTEVSGATQVLTGKDILKCFAGSGPKHTTPCITDTLCKHVVCLILTDKIKQTLFQS